MGSRVSDFREKVWVRERETLESLAHCWYPDRRSLGDEG